MNSKTTLTKRKNVLAAMVGLFAAAGGASSAMAQGDEAATAQGRIDEIVVTAQKREQRLIDVPISISAILGEDLDNAGIQNIADLSYAIPSLSTVEIGPGLQILTIRGVGNIRGTSPTVGIYLDGIPVSSGVTSALDLQVLDLKRAEVLKGPQGTLYGQGSLGGTIRYITNDPSFEGVEGKVTLSAYDTHKGGWNEEVAGFVNIPVIDDTLAFRVSATYKDKSGWIDQPAAGQEDINDSELSNIRVKGLWQVSDDLALRGTTIRHRNNYGATSIVNSTPVKESILQRAAIPDQPVTPGISNYDLYNLTIDYDLNFALLTSSSSLIDQEAIGENSQIATLGGGVPIELLAVYEEYAAKSFTQDIRLTSNENSGQEIGLDWTFGVFYSDLETKYRRDHLWISFNNGAPFDSGTNPWEETSKSIAYYADASYEITDQFTFGLGARYFDDDRTRIEFYGADNGILREASFDNLSSRVYLNYAWTDSVNSYFNVSEGFRSGGFNRDGVDFYEPEQLLAYELGTKSALLNNRLQLTMAYFYGQYDDYQTLTQIFDSASNSFITITSNVGEGVIKGFEWSLDWAVTEQLSIGFNGAVTDAEFTQINGTSSAPPNIKGDRLPFVPEYGYSVNTNYRFNWTESVVGDFYLSYNREGQNTVTDRGAGVSPVTYKNKPFGFLDAQLSAKWQSFSVKLFGENLLDEDNLVGVSISNQTPQHRPRSLGVRLSYDF